MRGFLVIGGILAMIVLHNLTVDGAYNQGRVDKHAEIMEFISGDRMARLSVWSHDKRTVYSKAGVCSACHMEG